MAEPEVLDLQKALAEKSMAFASLLDSLDAGTREVWEYLVGYFRTHYVMDESWDKGQMKFRRGGRTLVSLILKENEDKVVALVILGKAEREKFELVRDQYSAYIQTYYDQCKTYYDGKWMFIDVVNLDIAKEIIRLIALKRKPNRKPLIDTNIKPCCGSHCDHCLFNKANYEKEDRRIELNLGFAKCYGDTADYSQSSCDGCDIVRGMVSITGGCEKYLCAKEKNIADCSACPETLCSKEKIGIVPGRCIPGLTAQEVTDFIMPYTHNVEL